MADSVIVDIRAAKEETSRGGSVEGKRGKPGVRIEDEALIPRVAEAEDDRSLFELYDRYAGMVYAMGLRHLHDRSLVEDFVQDVFTSVWRKAKSFECSKASFMTWIYQIARNRATDLDRKRRVRPRSAGSEPQINQPGSDNIRSVAANIDVTEALSRLSPEHQKVLVLAYFKALTQREIASTTGVVLLGTIKSRATAALRALRKTMLPKEADDG